MTTREHVILVCDMCRTEGPTVETHSLALDGKEVEVEACSRCWTKAETAVVPLVEAGRKPGKRPRRVA